MQRYAIYQLPFENANSRDVYFMSPEEIEAISDQYEFVGIIDGLSVDHVFETSNCLEFMPERESLIERVGEMSSLSVGDIVHNLTTDVTYLCLDCGWATINMKETA